MIILRNFDEELAKYGLDRESYEKVLSDIDSKMDSENDLDWSEIKDKHSVNCNSDTIRKSSSTIFGGKFRTDYLKDKLSKAESNSNKNELDEKIDKLRKERIKLQTANVERSRIDRAEARQELYYENIATVIKTLPLPEFNPLFDEVENNDIDYIVGLADIHYGATYKSINNEYSPSIAKDRLEYLTEKLIEFIVDKKLRHINILGLGDDIQGLLRMSDLKINDSSVVKATVEISRLIASMINSLSKYTTVTYYHTPNANHSQIRPLGSKASEIADEDLEYVIGNYIKDLLSVNERAEVVLANEGDDYLEIDLAGNLIIAMHGHQLKSVDSAIRDLSILHQRMYDLCILGHYHNGKEVPSHEGVFGDCEVLVCPSFVGSDPYSDRISKGSKSAVKIFGIDKIYGHTETYKIILN